MEQLLDTYRRIAKVDLRFPSTMSSDVKDLVGKVYGPTSCAKMRN